MKKFLVLFSFVLLLSGCQVTDSSKVPDTDNVEDSMSSENEDISNSNSDIPDEKTSSDEQASIEGKISVDEPFMNAKVASPLIVKGEVLGNWFFEGSFPVKLVDDQGKELASSSATSTEDWMTEAMIPFSAELTFSPGTATSGKVILEKDNPSGLEENAGKLEIPVNF